MKDSTMLIAPELISRVREGTKRSTVRKGTRNLREGDSLTLADELGNEVGVTVTDVVVKPVYELTEGDAIRDGVDSLGDLLRLLTSFYEDLESDDLVTVIGFEVTQSS
jgi:hypothetical protein